MKMVLVRYSRHQIHQQRIMINRHIGFLKHWRKFILIWCIFIMSCRYWNAQFHALYLQFLHEIHHTGRNRTKIMVFQLLPFRWRMPQKGFSCHQKVWSGLKKSRIYKEIFLFPAKCSRNFGYIFIKILTNFRSCLIHSV